MRKMGEGQDTLAAATIVSALVGTAATALHQWLEGERQTGTKAMIDCEVSATLAQLDLAILPDADLPFREFLAGYAGDRNRVRERLETGDGLFGSLFAGRPRYADHFPVL